MDFAHFVGVTTFAPICDAGPCIITTKCNLLKIALVNNEKPAYIVY